MNGSGGSFLTAERCPYRRREMTWPRETRLVADLSAEFLIGPQLGANLVNLGIFDAMREALAGHGVRLAEILDR